MFDIEISIYRERLKRHPITLPILLTMVLMGTVLFGASSGDVVAVRVVRDSGLTSCQKKLAASSFSECSNFCSTLQERLQERAPWREINTILILLFTVTVPVTLAACILHICCCLKPPKSTVIDVTPEEDPMAVWRHMVLNTPIVNDNGVPIIENSCVSLTGDAEADKFSLEDVAPATPAAPGAAAQAKNDTAATRGRTETPQQALIRKHLMKRRKEHLEAIDPKNFRQMGPIYMPRECSIPPPAVLPDNIILDKVEFHPDHNEMYIIGSDVDDIELEPSTLAESSKSDSRTEKKRKKNSKTSESKSSKSTKQTKSEKKSKKEQLKPPKKKSGENPAPQKKPSKETLPVEKKASKETLPVEKKASKEKEMTTPEKKASKEGVVTPEVKDEKIVEDEKKVEEEKKNTEE